MKVLVIEDEAKAARFLQKGLSENGFAVEVAADGEQGLALFQTTRFDLVIADVAMPNLNGIEVVKEIRRQKKPTPIVLLTARDSLHDRVAGIEAGADVYLVKPFSFSELLAYARTLTNLRKGGEIADPVLRIGDLEVDLPRQKARRGETQLDLTAKEFALLALLARRQGQVLSRTVIAEEVWDLNYDPGSNVVDVHIGRLRAKVDDPFSERLIWTVRGSGYVLEQRGSK